jgi:sugar/nucleoside kinase (ribokinase family)
MEAPHMSSSYDVVAIGNAIMDIITPVEDGFITANGMERNAMNLIDADRALTLHTAARDTGQDRMIAGGSGVNSLVGLAEMGFRTGLIAKVGKDRTGQALVDGFERAGVDYRTPPTNSGTPSARSMIFVTPDGARTMNTFLGASVEFERSDVLDDMIRASKLLYLEGYLFDGDEAKAAFVHAAEVAHAAGRKVALSLSDPFCVHRHKASFQQLVKSQTDLLFANEEELFALTDTDSIDAGLDAIEASNVVICVTRGARGSIISDGKRRYHVKAAPVERVIDTTGAGDQYAAGVMAGYTLGLNWADAGYLGSLAAAEVIQHYGARPETSIHDIAVGLGR